MRTCIRLAGVGALALFALLALLPVNPPPTQAAHGDEGAAPPVYQPALTIVSSDITTHTTWTKAGSPYSVTQTIQVRPGITLTVQPGVEVLSASTFGAILVPGTLVAIGSAAEPITFTSPTKQPGSWGYVNIGIGGRATLQHVLMEYGTNPGLPGYGILNIDRGSATVTDSVFRYGGSNGIAASLGVTSSVQVSATSFISNGRSAIRLNGVGTADIPSDPLLRNLTASLNGLNAVEYVASTLQGAHLWEAAGIPYATRSGFTVKGSLTLEPGVEVQSDSLFSVYGPVTALGTPGNPITFTSINKAPGGWWGINVAAIPSSTGILTLSNATLEYGGAFNGANLYVDTGGIVSVTQSVVRGSSRNGVTVRGGESVVQMTGVTVTNNAGYPLVLDGPADPVFRNITASGNLTQAIGVGTGYAVVTGKHLWESLGLPYQTTWSLNIGISGTLVMEPGVEVRVAKGYAVNVDGFLAAVGTVTQPITFTGAFTGATTPGWWSGVYVGIPGRAMLGYCDIGYGGAAGHAMVTLRNSKTIMENCRIHHSAADGIVANGFGGGNESRPLIRFNRIEQNAFGYRNANGGSPPETVDARWNWWGDPTGPLHATNPGGLGNPVNDYVIFDPWLTSPQQSVRELDVQLSGPDNFVPGKVENYAVGYTNNTTQTLQNAVLMVALPSYAEYLDNSGGGNLWPKRRQLFWKLGNLPPAAFGIVTFRVRFLWGLPLGLKDSVVAVLGGTNMSPPDFTVQPYLDYVPVTVVAEQALSPADVQAERQAYPEFEQLYTLAVQEGYTPTLANRLMLSAGEPVTEVILLRRQAPLGATFLRRQGSRIQALVVDETSYLVRTADATISFNFQTDDWDIIGGAALASSQGPDAVSLTFGQCMKNCILELVPKAAAKLVFKSVSVIFKAYDCYKAVSTGDELQWAKCAQIIKKVPGVSEGIDLGKCNSDCKQNPDSHYCTQDIRYCDTGGFPYGIFGIHSIASCKCITNPATGRAGQYMGCTTEGACAICEKCVEGESGPVCTIPSSPSPQLPAPTLLSAVSSNPDSTCSECVRAKDPNAKYGPGGDVLPGQWMTYTVTYENEGSGTAYDVFVVDPLSEHLDTSTLTVLGGGEYLAANRTIIWFVGQLAPKGQPGSTGVVSFTVRLKPNLPNGTAIVNRAVVHFPSVPEETPTNTVVNLVQPLVALPQSLETNAGQPLAIHLQGVEPLGAPLTFQVVEAPLNGELSGAAPNLIYTPTINFTGMDRLRFTVSNALTTSRPAEVQILVHPSPSDVTPPQVIRTSPASGAVISMVVGTPHFTDTEGSLYLPAIQIDFSEAISETTVTTSTVQVRDAGGQLLPIRLAYDGAAYQAVALFRVPLQAGRQYTVTVTNGVRDLIGNPLPANYVWSFHTGGNGVYLPLIRR